MFKLLNALLNVGATASDTVSEVVSDTATKIEFNPQGFVEMLPLMGKGMLVIFILIGAIILTTLLVNKLFSKKQ